MKRKILLIFILFMLIFIPSVRAEDNMKLIFNTSFEEEIILEKIDKIFIMMDDVNRKDYELVLQKKDNFHLELNNLPSGDIQINSINVARDYTVEYDYQYAITKTSEEEMTVSLLVTKVEKDPNRQKVQISKEEIAAMLGYDPLNIVSSGVVTSSTNTTNSTTTNSTIIDPDEPVDINPNKTTTSSTTTLSEQEIREQESEKKEEEKKESQKKRNSIYLIVILAVLAIIIVIGIIVGIKIANANK